MEGIETVDAILSMVYPGSDFDRKMKQREERAKIDIKQIKMDRLESVFVPLFPVSLMIDHSQKIGE
ncbi:MAG: hypothetical protein ACO1N0_17150 [Fluviicola sp.]